MWRVWEDAQGERTTRVMMSHERHSLLHLHGRSAVFFHFKIRREGEGGAETRESKGSSGPLRREREIQHAKQKENTNKNKTTERENDEKSDDRTTTTHMNVDI